MNPPFDDHDYYQALDKRTKEYKQYKEWLKSQPSQGLGDTIEKVTKATGIKQAVDFIFDKLGKDCGCDKRKEKLNKLFAYDPPLCLEEEEYKWLDQFFTNKRELVTSNDQGHLLKIHNRIFKHQEKPSSCGPCVRNLIKKLERVYNEYEKK